MSAWTSASALREQLRKRWDSGDLLAEQVASNMLFPLRLTVRGPSSSELSERFDARAHGPLSSSKALGMGTGW
jgi:hypothetical protein